MICACLRNYVCTHVLATYFWVCVCVHVCLICLCVCVCVRHACVSACAHSFLSASKSVLLDKGLRSPVIRPLLVSAGSLTDRRVGICRVVSVHWHMLAQAGTMKIQWAFHGDNLRAADHGRLLLECPAASLVNTDQLCRSTHGSFARYMHVCALVSA